MQNVVFLIERYGLVVVFLNMLLDQAGLPIPAYPTLMVAAALAANSVFKVPEIVVAGVLGSVIADIAWYAASRQYGRSVLALVCRVSLSPDSCVRQTETMFARVGAFSLLFAKFVPGLGIVSIALSGLTEVPLLSFIVLDVLGSTLFVGLAVALGVVFRNAIFQVLTTLTDLGLAGLAIVGAALAVYLLVRFLQRQAFIRHLRMNRITVDELGTMIDRGETPIILDVRPDLVRYEEGIIPGAVFAHPSDAGLSLAAFSRDTEIVVYCSCPNEASAAIAARHLRRAGFTRIRPLLGGIEAWAEAGRPVHPHNTNDSEPAATLAA